MVSFRFKRPCMPPVVITQRRLTLPARSDRSGAAFRNRWGTVSKEVGHRYDREPKSAPLPVETAPHFVRNCAPLPVGISAPFRPESAPSFLCSAHSFVWLHSCASGQQR